MSESVNVTKDSIQIPYRRFLSDSAAGLAAILLGISAYYRPILGTPLNRVLPSGTVGTEVKVFTLLLLFLLATPIGFAVNAFSWFVFGQAIAYVERLCAFLNEADSWLFPIEDVAGSRHTTFIQGQLKGEGLTFDQIASFVRETLDIPPLARLSPETQVRGLVYFLRNLGFLALVVGFANFVSVQDHPGEGLVPIALMFVLTLTIRWRLVGRTTARKLFAAAVVLLTGFCTYWSVTRSVAGIWYMVASVVLVLLAGLVGFYNGCDILLHWYIVRIALDESREDLSDAPRTLATAAKMLRVAALRKDP